MYKTVLNETRKEIILHHMKHFLIGLVMSNAREELRTAFAGLKEHVLPEVLT